VSYKVTVRNVGETTATAVTVTDSIVGSAMEYVSGSTNATYTTGTSASNPTTPTASSIVWGFGGGAQIAPGGMLTLTYKVRVKSGVPYGSYPDTVSVTAKDASGFAVAPDGSRWIAADTDPDDADPESVWVTVPALSVTKSLSSADATIQAGQSAQFTIVVRNTGDSRIATVPVSDLFNDDDLSYLTASPLPSLTSTGSLSWFNVGPLNAGQATTLTVSFVADAAPAGNKTVDTALVGPSVDVAGLAVPSRSATASVAITRPSLSVTKTVASGPTKINRGDATSFNVVIRNNGDTRIPATSLVDSFPSGLVFTGGTPLANASTVTTHATSVSSVSGWSNTGNSLGAPDGVSSTSGNPAFEMPGKWMGCDEHQYPGGQRDAAACKYACRDRQRYCVRWQRYKYVAVVGRRG